MNENQEVKNGEPFERILQKADFGNIVIFRNLKRVRRRKVLVTISRLYRNSGSPIPFIDSYLKSITFRKIAELLSKGKSHQGGDMIYCRCFWILKSADIVPFTRI